MRNMWNEEKSICARATHFRCYLLNEPTHPITALRKNGYRETIEEYVNVLSFLFMLGHWMSAPMSNKVLEVPREIYLNPQGMKTKCNLNKDCFPGSSFR